MRKVNDWRFIEPPEKKQVPATQWKWHSLIPELNISVCAVFVLNALVNEEEIKGLTTAWEELIGNPKSWWRNNPTPEHPHHIIKLYLARTPVPRQQGEDTRFRLFKAGPENESWYEVALAKPDDMRGARIACFRRKRIATINGVQTELDGYRFGFGLPDPRTGKDSNPHAIGPLREYRPGTNPEWRGFEPLFLKVFSPPLKLDPKKDLAVALTEQAMKGYPQTPCYYKLWTEWEVGGTAEETYISVCSQKDPPDLPEEFRAN